MDRPLARGKRAFAPPDRSPPVELENGGLLVAAAANHGWQCSEEGGGGGGGESPCPAPLPHLASHGSGGPSASIRGKRFSAWRDHEGRDTYRRHDILAQQVMRLICFHGEKYFDDGFFLEKKVTAHQDT